MCSENCDTIDRITHKSSAHLLTWGNNSLIGIPLAVLAFKVSLYRAPPNNQNAVPHPERLFSDPASQSYPSGHLVVAIVWYGVLALLLTGLVPDRWRRLLRRVPPAVLFVTTVYLSFHWLTDSIAGLLLGLLLYRLLMRVPWDNLPLGRRLATAGWAGPGLRRS